MFIHLVVLAMWEEEKAGARLPSHHWPCVRPPIASAAFTPSTALLHLKGGSEPPFFRSATVLNRPNGPLLVYPRILALLALVLSCLARAVHNETIDDASPLITYNDATLQRKITAFDSSLLSDGTVTYIVPIPDSSPTITIPFNGTAIYIFVAYPGRIEPAPSGFTVLIDGVPSGNWAAKESALLYHLVYHNGALPDASHTLVMQIMSGWEFYFTYAVYTNELSIELGEHPAESQCEDLDTVNCFDAVSISRLTQTLSGEDSTVLALGLTLSGTSPAVGRTSQAAGTAAATSSNNTAIIRMAGNPPVVPMIGAFLGGALFGGLVMLHGIHISDWMKRSRSQALPNEDDLVFLGEDYGRNCDIRCCCTRNRKRVPWIFNAAGFAFDERSPTGGKGTAREKPTSTTDFGEPEFEMMEDVEVLAHVRAEMRWLRASVQRLERDIPEGRLGGPLGWRPLELG
ncbi:hypothetical protein B0H13DRAFT_2348445 [Mycena leptocephala]|nr:hypothetical protein B0H13DRAFT_2348445 [Mycena leptocephala]